MALVTAFALTMLIRLIPTLYTGNIFSNDVWPLVRIANHVMSNPNDRLFGLAQTYGHHIYWPSAVIESVMYSLVTDVDIALFYRFIGVSMLSIILAIIAYLLLKKRHRSFWASIAAVLSISLIPSFTLYTSAYLKEFLGHALLAVLIYTVLYISEAVPSMFLVILASSSLVLSHPLTTAMFIAIVFGYVYVNIAGFIKKKEKSDIRLCALVALSVAAILYTIHLFIVARPVTPTNMDDIVMLSIYAITGYLSYILLGGRITGILLGLFVALAFIPTLHTITVTFSVLLVLLVIPPLLSVPYDVRDDALGKVKVSVLLTVAIVFIYISTHMVEALGIIHRVFNYLVYALIIVISNISESHRKVCSVALLALLSINVLSIVATLTGANPYTFYWVYRDFDVKLITFVDAFSQNVSIYSDPKYSQASKLINPIPPQYALKLCDIMGAVVMNTDNYRFGLPLTAIDFVKPPLNLSVCRSRVYDNGYGYVFA